MKSLAFCSVLLLVLNCNPDRPATDQKIVGRPVVISLENFHAAGKPPRENIEKVGIQFQGMAMALATLVGPGELQLHEREDRSYFVLDGTLGVKYQDKQKPVMVKEGSLLMIPRNVPYMLIPQTSPVKLLVHFSSGS